MTQEKASTLRLLREGMNRTVHLLESKGGDSLHEVRALLPDVDVSGKGGIPILFLITSLAFLEANPVPSVSEASDPPEEEGLDEEGDFREVDGWTPADFLSHLRYEPHGLRITLETIRGRAVRTEVELRPGGDLRIRTRGRGFSATRWLGYVGGKTHLTLV